MSRFRKVYVKQWVAADFRALSRPKPNGQSLFLYLQTGPHTTAIPGLFRASQPQLAADLGWPLRGFIAAWREIEARGMGRADWRAGVVFLPAAIKDNRPESPSVVKSWGKLLEEIPSCSLKQTAIAVIGAELRACGAAWAAAWPTACETASPIPWSQGVPHQEQEQEKTLPEQEETLFEQEQETPPAGERASGFDAFWNLYPLKKNEAQALKA